MQSFLNPSSITIIGLSIRTSNERERNPETVQIGRLWKRFFDEGIAARISDRMKPHRLYAAYTDYSSDETGDYTVIVGGQTASAQAVPDGLQSHTIPHGSYREFTASGPMPGALIQAWVAIHTFFKTSPEKRAFTTDFEIHNSLHPEEVSIYIRCR